MKLLLLMLLLLLLYKINCIIQQTMVNGRTLMYTNNWLQPIDINRKLQQSSLQSPPTQRTSTISASASVIEAVAVATPPLAITPTITSKTTIDKMAMMKAWPQEFSTTRSNAIALLHSYKNNALESLTQLIKYLKQNHYNSIDQSEIQKSYPTLLFNYTNFEDELMTSTTPMPTTPSTPSTTTPSTTTTTVTTTRIRNTLWHNEEMTSDRINGIFIPINVLLDKIKQICDVVKDIIPTRANVSSPGYHNNIKKDDLASYVATNERSLKSSKTKKRSIALVMAERQAKSKKKYNNSITSALSSLLAPLSMPVMAAMTATKSLLALEEDEARHKHKKHKRVKKKLRKFLLPLLLAYKLKFLTLIPLLLGGLVLLVGTTGMAGFFFALFAAVMSLRSTRAFGK